MTIKNTEINQYLEHCGLKHSNSGYRYLVTAIQIGATSPEMLQRISDLYEKVAEVHNTKGFRVEKAIRYSVLVLNQTNKEFITRAVDDFNYQ